MEKFTAEDARMLVHSFYMTEFDEVIEKIKAEARKGNLVLHIYNSNLSKQTVESLKTNRFSVEYCYPAHIQKDSLYQIISWK
jgi:hypothetical protein